MDAFDADVLISAATAGHPLGQRVRALFPVDAVPDTAEPVGCGSVLLVPELLAKPLREEADDEVAELAGLLGRLELRPVDLAVAELAAILGVTYRLRAVDAVHLATAVAVGADRFVTNNSRDFTRSIAEIDGDLACWHDRGRGAIRNRSTSAAQAVEPCSARGGRTSDRTDR